MSIFCRHIELSAGVPLRHILQKRRKKSDNIGNQQKPMANLFSNQLDTNFMDV